jgi:CheY-like chemotaxis protein
MTEQPTVLIVDDRRENLSVLEDVLDRAGYRVLVAEDGKTGIAQAIRALPDVILLDITMPVLDGFGACKALKADERTKDIPVVFITARHETVDRARSIALGGVDHVTKPFRPEEVLARVHVHAKLARQSRAVKSARALLDEARAQLASSNPAVDEKLASAIAALASLDDDS